MEAAVHPESEKQNFPDKTRYGCWLAERGERRMRLEGWENVRRRLFDAEDETVMIVSHRGRFSSSVMENTSLAFCLALQEGADMVEMDLDRTKDGVLVGHHDRTLERLFHDSNRVEDYFLDELRAKPFYNYVGEDGEEKIETFEEMLKVMKGRTCLVLDKCWRFWDEAYEQLDRENMMDQAVFKFYIEDREAYDWALSHKSCTFVPMVKEERYLELAADLKKYAFVPAVEILPEKETDPIYQKETILWCRERKMKVWCNSLSLGRRLVYGAGNDDLKSLRSGGEYGWGRLVQQGITIIQTDWPYELRQYLEKIGAISPKE